MERQSYRNKTENTKGTSNNTRSIYPTEGKDELNEEFYEALQKILDKVNKNDYITLIGDMNARVGNNRVANIVVANGEATLNNNGKKLTDFCTFNNLKITSTFLSNRNP